MFSNETFPPQIEGVPTFERGVDEQRGAGDEINGYRDGSRTGDSAGAGLAIFWNNSKRYTRTTGTLPLGVNASLRVLSLANCV